MQGKVIGHGVHIHIMLGYTYIYLHIIIMSPNLFVISQTKGFELSYFCSSGCFLEKQTKKTNKKTTNKQKKQQQYKTVLSESLVT